MCLLQPAHLDITDPKVCIFLQLINNVNRFVNFDWILKDIVVILECQVHQVERVPLDQGDQKGMLFKYY